MLHGILVVLQLENSESLEFCDLVNNVLNNYLYTIVWS